MKKMMKLYNQYENSRCTSSVDYEKLVCKFSKSMHSFLVTCVDISSPQTGDRQTDGRRDEQAETKIHFVDGGIINAPTTVYSNN